MPDFYHGWLQIRHVDEAVARKVSTVMRKPSHRDELQDCPVAHHRLSWRPVSGVRLLLGLPLNAEDFHLDRMSQGEFRGLVN